MSNDKALIGVDIGTQGVKAGLFEADGRCLATAFVPSRLHEPEPGVVEEDPEYQLTTVCDVIATCMRDSGFDAGRVAGMAVDGQMAGVIGVGQDGRNVTPYDSWLDTRCAPYIDTMATKAGSDVVRKAGCPPSINHGPKMLWWKHERPEDYARIAAFVQPGGYVAMRLCGLEGSDAFIDTSYLHFTGFADNRHGRWAGDLLETFGLDGEKLPRIVKPHDIVGGLTAALAEQCGLSPDTPVVAGCGDTAASFLAAGAAAEGICVDVAGTASVFAATTSAFAPDLDHRTVGCSQAATPGLWHPYAYINGGGMNLEWFRKQIAGFGMDADALSFEALNNAAAEVEPAEDLPLFVPHLGGRVSPGWPHLRGAWAGLAWKHSAGHLYRAILESVALEYGIYRDIVGQLNPELAFREIRVTGGGEKSNVWNQLKADALQLDVVQLTREEGAPLGSALLAGFGAGVFDDLPAAASVWVQTGRRYTPNRDLGNYYRARREAYRRLLDTLHDWTDKNTT